MYRKLATAMVAISAIAAAGGCAATPLTGRMAPQAPAAEQPAAKPPCTGNEVVVRDGEETDCDVSPPQTMTVIANGADHVTVAECDHVGGRFVDGTEVLGGVCEDIDY